MVQLESELDNKWWFTEGVS